MIRMHYKEATLVHYRRQWNRLISYFDKKGELYFSESTALEFVDKESNFFEKEKKGELTQSNVYLFRMVRMVGDFQKSGTVPRRYSRTLSKVNKSNHIEILGGFSSYGTKNQWSRSTRNGYQRSAENFLSYLEANGIDFADVSGSVLSNYVLSLMGYSSKMVEYVLCGVRSLLRFSYESNYIKVDLAASVPSVKVQKRAKVPSRWSDEDLKKLIAAIDMGNPSGKRDYAIILMACRLGIRCIDIKNLKFSNINWKERKIEFVQSKTGVLNELPLLKDVGWAIINYIKDGRPQCDCDNVFVRHLAPIGPFAEEDHLHQIIEKYIRQAKIKIKDHKVGMHSLRHTLASNMTEKHIPIQEIAEIMGHLDTDSTAIYLKSSLGLLKECTLDIDEL